MTLGRRKEGDMRALKSLEENLESDLLVVKTCWGESGKKVGEQKRVLYLVSGLAGGHDATIEEHSTENLSGLFQREVIGYNRSVTLFLVNKDGEKLLEICRPYNFFSFYSNTTVKSADGKNIGVIQKRMHLIKRQWTLKTASGNVVATLKQELLNMTYFKILDERENHNYGNISCDLYRKELWINFGVKKWKSSQRILIFAAAIAIDWDYYRGGLAFRGAHPYHHLTPP